MESARSEEEDGGDDFPRDSDGSAKVALIGIDRSLAYNTIHLYGAAAGSFQFYRLTAFFKKKR
jgi:hypothetical protein